jgi:hypothetical protein
MKKMILTAALAVVTVVTTAVGAHAQNFNRGDWFLGAQSTGLTLATQFEPTTSANPDKITNLDLGAMGGWFFAPRFAVDAMVSFSYRKPGRLDGVSFRSVNNLNFGAGLRYYPVAGLFGRVGYTGATNTLDDALDSAIRVGVGYDLFVSQKVFFEPTVWYAKHFEGGSNMGLSIGVGVKF